MTKISVLVSVAVLAIATTAQATPTLQVGAPGGPGEGTYADYLATLENPTEQDTAVTSGSTIYIAGVWGPNTIKLGSAYDAVNQDWSDLDPPGPVTFDGHGAILIVSVPDGTLGLPGNTITVDGLTPFASSTTFDVPSNIFNNHDPVKNNISDFLFFDIGDIGTLATISNEVPNFQDETGSALGEIKTLTLKVSGYEWAHIDVMAIETDSLGKSKIVSTIDNNPGSHDVTWGTPPVPEPATLILLGSGLAALGLIRRRRK